MCVGESIGLFVWWCFFGCGENGVRNESKWEESRSGKCRAGQDIVLLLYARQAEKPVI